MRRYIFILLLMGSWLAIMGSAQAEVRLSVVATDPSAGVVSLGRDEPFYVRIEYAADEPIRIWVRPYFNGKEVMATKTNASNMYSGRGYALGWFSLDRPSQVDEVHLRVGGGKPWREWDVAIYPVTVVGTGLPATVRAKASWVDELLREEEATRQQAYEKRMSEPTSVADSFFMSGFMLVVLSLLLAGFAAPTWALWKWRGGWRIAAAVPAVLMAFVVLRIVVDATRDPTSHNLWPFEILEFGMVSLAIMGALTIARRIARTED